MGVQKTIVQVCINFPSQQRSYKVMFLLSVLQIFFIFPVMLAHCFQMKSYMYIEKSYYYLFHWLFHESIKVLYQTCQVLWFLNFIINFNTGKVHETRWGWKFGLTPLPEFNAPFWNIVIAKSSWTVYLE